MPRNLSERRRWATIRWRDVAVVAVMAVVVVGFGLVLAGGGTVLGGLLRVVVAVAVVGAIMVLGHRHRAAAGVVLIGVALVGLAAGEALAYGRRPGVGPSVQSIGAALLLVASAVLALTASVGLVVDRRTWVRRAIAGVALLAVWAGARPLFVAPVAEAVRMTNVVRRGLGPSSPADLGLRYRDVTFTATDGTALSGWYLPTRNGAAVVVSHGSSATRTSVLDHAAVLARHGYGVLLFDSRGQGRSEGRAMDLGWYGDEDLHGAVAWLAAENGVDRERIGIVGLSLGGEEAIGAAATDARVRAVVADGATYRRLGDWTPHHDTGFAGLVFDEVMFLTADLLSEAAPPPLLADAVTELAPTPLLLIASGSGEEIAAARAFRERSPATVEVWEVPDATHTGELAAHPREWERRVLAFLDANLGPG